MNKQIEKVHFQITRNCNLKCEFCGQWGKKGFFSNASGKEMTIDDWNRIISELEEYREKTKVPIKITVWGGEPLVSPDFDVIIKSLKDKHFQTEVITNGVLINRHKDIINKYVDKLYISLDGTRAVHDEIRGMGVFDTVCKNIRDIKHNNVIIMSVITPKLIAVLPEFLDELETLGIKQLYLQDMIGMSKEEIVKYKVWMKQSFNIEAKDIEAWENNNLFKIDNIQIAKEYSFKIEHKKHINSMAVCCKSPFSHVHVTWNGNVLFCTDFYDFTAGNINEGSLESIFNNKISEKYRQEILVNNCATCKHCSWRNS